MGFYSDFMLVPTGPTTTTATSSLVNINNLDQYNLNDNINNPYQTPIWNDLVPAGQGLNRHGVFDHISSSGEVSPSPALPLNFARSREPVFELGDDLPHTAKRMKVCIKEACDQAGLGEEERLPAQKFSKLHQHQHDTLLFIKLQSIEK
ncbi:hypothetical protein E1B28_005159 [Marasmius oreades]|uniref:Uncharacterized protein n=1 Tax=Marasmius oreades TaxID=181124 RepID=A0A9P8ADQ3_9AGAR|nr:uncharacterized protein E1B28_005159 [Marasmius oreades]KAG7097844.1 hypothetical protein E1B28_005159 [Marasmius oreades]